MSQEKKTPAQKAQNPNIFGRIARWFRALISELKKVTWPGRPQILNNTWVVLVVTGVCAVGIWFFDFVAGMGVTELIRIFR